MALTASMLLCLSAPIGLPPTRAAAQNRPQNATVGGTVTDESGEAIIGASIVVDGSGATIGTVTDINGKFSLNVKPGTMLRISYVGYATMTAEARPGMVVTLKENANELQGVEVVAYGTQKKVTVTGAISSIKGEDLVRSPVSSINNVLPACSQE